MANSLMLNSQWDIFIDPNTKQLATTGGSYAIAQNVANACRLFTEDAFYDPDRGVPHFLLTLGQKLSRPIARAELQSAALSVEGVASAKLADVTVENRALKGDLKITTESGDEFNVTI